MALNPYMYFINQNWNLMFANLNDGLVKKFPFENVGTNFDNPQLKRVSTSSTCAWGLGCDEKLYICVYKTDAPIRVNVECYENIRWSIRHGWSTKSMLFTDRWVWSNRNGKVELKKDSFTLPTNAWVWERDWSVDVNADCDFDGWQYAMDFPAQYHKSMSRLSFVRRRKWSRNRIYKGFNQWFNIDSPVVNDPIQDVSIGGYEVPFQKEGYHIVWVVTLHGKVFYREGITRDSPEGTSWHFVPTNPDINIVHLCVGPTGLLWGCTWSGQAVIRLGVSFQNPGGKDWGIVDAPVSQVIMQVGVGINCVWALTTERRILFRKSVSSNYKKNPDSSEYPCGASWVELSGKFSLISVGPKEQLWAIGYEDGDLYYRSHLSIEELMGREWQKLHLQKQDFEHCIWMHAGSCYITSEDLTKLSQPKRYKTTIGEWRDKLLNGLQERNFKTKELYKEEFYIKELTQDEEVFTKQIECLLQVNSYHDIWCKCYLKLIAFLHDEQIQQSLIFYFKEEKSFKESTIPIKSILCVHQIFNPLRPYTFKVQQNFTDNKSFIVSFNTLKEYEEWFLMLNPAENNDELNQNKLFPSFQYDKCLQCNEKKELLIKRYPLGKMILTSNIGHVYVADYFSEQNHSCFPHWSYVNGFLKKVVCGYNDILWGIGLDGKVFVYDKYNNENEQNCVKTYEIYENQRWNPIEGYSSRLLPSDRWHWSDETGLIKCSKEHFQLPSKLHKWIDDWCVDYKNNCDNDGWQYAADFPRSYHCWRGVNDYVRRRKWRRSCHITCKANWMEVPTDARLIDLSINMTSPVSIWAVTSQGDLLIRRNVDETCPQGTDWFHLSTSTPITSVSIGVNNRVWCSGANGDCFVRVGFSKQHDHGARWLETSKEDIQLKGISVGKSVVVSIDENGILYRRMNITQAYPEGTSWFAVISDVTDVCVNSLDEVFFIQNKELKVMSFIPPDKFTDAITLLSGDWTSIFSRAMPQDQPNIIEVEDTNCSESAKKINADINTSDQDDGVVSGNNVVETSPISDPYSVDIYSIFSNESEEDISSYLNDLSVTNS